MQQIYVGQFASLYEMHFKTRWKDKAIYYKLQPRFSLITQLKMEYPITTTWMFYYLHRLKRLKWLELLLIPNKANIEFMPPLTITPTTIIIDALFRDLPQKKVKYFVQQLQYLNSLMTSKSEKKIILYKGGDLLEQYAFCHLFRNIYCEQFVIILKVINKLNILQNYLNFLQNQKYKLKI